MSCQVRTPTLSSMTALFSLSHHYIVWLAAELSSYRGRFTRYAVLGDDVVIADAEVAKTYAALLDKMGVSISKDKSLISCEGALEFAKRFMVKRAQKDLSPISLRALLTVRSTLGMCQLADLYKISNPNVLFRLAGAGFRVRSRLYSSKRSKRWERLWVASTKPPGTSRLPLEWWIGRGRPINPYLKGLIIERLRKELKPKELRLFPEEIVFDGEREILERTVILNWVKQWLRWVSWYYQIAHSPDPSLAEMFSAPICATSWKRSAEDIQFVRYGFLWKCYDMGAGPWSMGYCPPVLGNDLEIRFPGWILGGMKGTDFIMAPLDHQSSGEKSD